MNLPSDITQQILEYLHLEYGEEASDPDALKLSDLRYEGQCIVDGTETHFWSYPSGADRHWATVAEFNDSYCIGMSTSGPRGETIDKAKALRKVRVDFRTLSEEAKPMRPIRKDIKEETTIPVLFPSGRRLEITVEVYNPDTRPDVAIGITHEDDRHLYIRCTSGVVVSYETEYGYECLISVGTGPWEGNE